jgi:hypothetical protein
MMPLLKLSSRNQRDGTSSPQKYLLLRDALRGCHRHHPRGIYSNGLNKHDYKKAFLTKQIPTLTSRLDVLKAMDKEDVEMGALLAGQ